MGKKYIIELESGTHIFVLGPEGIVHIGEPDVVYETVDGMQIGDAVINAKPYTEPDLEQVRKEAYEQGYKDMLNEVNKEVRKSAEEIHAEITEDAYKRGYNTGFTDAKGGYENGFENGMIVAWEAARKIWQSDIYLRIFKVPMRMDCFTKFSASEAIEKIRQYEQEKEELGIQGYFKKGEEVIDADGTKAVVLNVSEDNYCQVYTEKGCIENWHIHTYKFHKTGRHFPEIATILEKMRGETNE